MPFKSPLFFPSFFFLEADQGCRSIITTALLSRVGEDFALILAKLEEHSPCSPPKEVKPSSSFPSTPARSSAFEFSMC